MSEYNNLRKWVKDFKNHEHKIYKNFFNVFKLKVVRAYPNPDSDSDYIIVIKTRSGNILEEIKFYLYPKYTRIDLYSSYKRYLDEEGTELEFKLDIYYKDGCYTKNKKIYQFDDIIEYIMSCVNEQFKYMVGKLLDSKLDFCELCKLSKSQQIQRDKDYKKSNFYYAHQLESMFGR